jgi:hypothetical protein
VFERRLIEKYIRENGTDPINGERLSEDMLIDIKSEYKELEQVFHFTLFFVLFSLFTRYLLFFNQVFEEKTLDISLRKWRTQ